MIRVFLLYVLPILLPSAMYFCWVAFTHRKDKNEQTKVVLVREGPWFRLIFAGLALMIIGLIITAFSGGMPIEGQYQAPYTKDGKIVPGRMVPKSK